MTNIVDYNFTLTAANFDNGTIILFDGVLAIDKNAQKDTQNITKITSNYNSSPIDNLLVDDSTNPKPDAQSYTDIFDYTSRRNFFPDSGVLIDMRNYDSEIVQNFLNGIDIEGTMIKTIRCYTDSKGQAFLQVVTDVDNPILQNAVVFQLSPVSNSDSYYFALPKITKNKRSQSFYGSYQKLIVIGSVITTSLLAIDIFFNKKK